MSETLAGHIPPQEQGHEPSGKPLANRKGDHTMSNPNMEAKIKELQELKHLREELEAEITAIEDEIKQTMGEE